MSIAAAPDTKRRALGKGLDSLLPRAQAPTPTPAIAEGEGGRPREISVDLIDRNPFQTRSQVNEEQLAELAASITANGVVQPILVRPHRRRALSADCRRAALARVEAGREDDDPGDPAAGVR